MDQAGVTSVAELGLGWFRKNGNPFEYMAAREAVQKEIPNGIYAVSCCLTKLRAEMRAKYPHKPWF